MKKKILIYFDMFVIGLSFCDFIGFMNILCYLFNFCFYVYFFVDFFIVCEFWWF